ncbi:MAG: protoporphyrinogen oxidase [Acidobacteria bacterium]|nr:MAG: protoporphyrinogen oxidase [Acidobacteriota bacterium]
MSQDLIIIGAGITGLTAAYEAQRRGLRPLVLEASARAGGLIQTDHVDGFTIEAGPDSVLAQKRHALELIRELGLGDEVLDVRPPGGAFVLRGRHLYKLPSPSLLGVPLTWQALAQYDLLPWSARLRMALEPLVPARRSQEDESIGSFFRRRFGAATVDLIAQPLLGGIHAGDIEHLSMRALFPRLLDAERTDGHVLKMQGARAGDPQKQDANDRRGEAGFRSLRHGMGTLVRALEARLLPDAVRYASAAQRLEPAARGWRVRSDDATFEAPAVIVAAPAFVAARLFATIDAEAARLCEEVPYVSTVSVALAWPRTAIAHPLSGTGFVVARRASDVRITACTWVSSKWEHRAPDHVALLRAFIGGAHDPEVVDLEEDELARIARTDLERVLGINAPPVLTRVYRWRRAGAQHNVGQRARMEALDRRLAQHPGLFVAGSGFRSVGIPDCIADARAVVARCTIPAC